MGETTTARVYAPEQVEEIRVKLRRVLDTEGITITDVSRQSGMAYTTLHAWHSGNYAGRDDLQAEKVKKWLDTRAMAVQTRALVPPPPEFIVTKSAEDFIGLFQLAQHLPDMVMITGAPGVGKTMAANAYLARASNVFLITAQPCHSTVRMFLDAVAHALGLGVVSTSERIARQIVHKLTGIQGLLIIDEAQHLSSPVMDQLRSFHDLAEFGIALVGNEHVVTRIDGFSRSTQYAQLHSRIGARVRRSKPLMKDIDLLVSRWEVAGEAERKLLRVIGQKPGALRGLTKCLRMALRLASVQGGSALTEENILMAWQQLGNETPAGA